MGISPQLAIDFKSTQNEKDLIETQNVQNFNSNKKFPNFLITQKTIKNLNKLEKYTTYKKIKAEEIKYSNTVLDLLSELVDNYYNEFITNIDDDFPGWSNLVNTIGRFQDMFYIVN